MFLGGGFVSLLLEKTEKRRYEKNKEKRKLLAEERKQLKEEQNKDVQEWEKNVLLKGFEEDIKSMWEVSGGRGWGWGLISKINPSLSEEPS